MKVCDIANNNGYTWYKIDNDKWIANDGTWLDFNKM